MNAVQPLVLVAAVTAVGVLHTMVPDHWLPISVYARSAGWSKRRTAGAAAIAGMGHTVSTLLLGLLMWYAGGMAAQRFGHLVSTISSAALVAFGLWILISAWRELRAEGGTHPHPPERLSQRMTLMLIVGSSPMLEGLPAFFAAGSYGFALVATMSLLFAIATIATYVVLCVASAAGLQRLRLGSFERYGEVFSGGTIALLGIVFWLY